ncbi:TolC family protein [Flaviaesturariibacter aridisoli]|uniref:TolC family protein n=1 Tax=Flaviaesturariibacter aridisoli TaxID=2545761 RepID=A0A4R4E1V9_9BACT|nr:TolC family protein [Flaviaesturariibacter aridisoli]TCZ73484.1 TolC family protein [Flaviaesturariibacter aridisoli]
MKKPISCFLGLLLGLLAQGQEQWDLRRCVDWALANNISVKQQDVQARLAQLTYEQAKLSQYPSLNLSTNYGYSTGRSIDPTTNSFTDNSNFFSQPALQSSVDLFNFFAKRNLIAANRIESMAARSFVDKVKNDIALNVATTYLTVLQARQQVQILRLKQTQTGAQLELTRKQVAAGALPELNAAQIEAQLAQDSANVVNAKTTEIQTLFNLKALLALDAAQPFDVVTPPVELIPVEPLGALQPDAVYQSALQNLPQQRYNALRIQAAQKNVAATRGAMYPTISAGAGVQSNYADVYTRFRQVGTTDKTTFIGNVNGNGAPVYFQQTGVPVLEPYNPTYFSQIGSNLREYVVLQLNVPIFNGGQARTAWKRSQLNLQNLQLQQTGDSLTIKQDIYKAYADAVNALEKFNAAGKAVDANQRAYDFASKRSAIGLLSTFELLTAQTNLFTAQLQRSSAQFEYVFRIKLLEFYKGQGLKL